jgi:hypothetical protein
VRLLRLSLWNAQKEMQRCGEVTGREMGVRTFDERSVQLNVAVLVQTLAVTRGPCFTMAES